MVGMEGYLLRHLVFSHVPCSSSRPVACAAFPSCRLPWGFPVTGCLSFCFPGDVGWASALPFFFCFSCSDCLQGLAGLCTLCQGAPVAVVSAWVEGAVTLLPFPYLNVDVLLAYGVSGVCGLRRQSRLPSWFVILFLCLFVLHLFWGGLVTGWWPLLRLLGFGLF